MQPDTDTSSACSCNDTCECKNQNISSMCLVCGKDNPFSLHAQIVEHPEQDEVVCYFTPQEMHQSYPDRVHGGISAAVLDEVIGRAVQMKHPRHLGRHHFPFPQVSQATSLWNTPGMPWSLH